MPFVWSHAMTIKQPNILEGVIGSNTNSEKTVKSALSFQRFCRLHLLLRKTKSEGIGIRHKEANSCLINCTYYRVIEHTGNCSMLNRGTFWDFHSAHSTEPQQSLQITTTWSTQLMQCTFKVILHNLMPIPRFVFQPIQATILSSRHHQAGILKQTGGHPDWLVDGASSYFVPIFKCLKYLKYFQTDQLEYCL